MHIIKNFMKNVSAEEFKKALESFNKGNSVFVDVRFEDEYLNEKIDNSVINIPLNEIDSHLKELEKYEKIYVNCKMGGRSAQACEILEKHGFKNVYNLEGGIEAWKKFLQKK